MPSCHCSDSKSGPATVAPSSNIAYTIVVTNNGPATAMALVLTDAVPAGTTFVSASGAGLTCSTPPAGGTGTVNCTLASLAPAGEHQAVVTAYDALGQLGFQRVMIATAPETRAAAPAEGARR